MPAGTDTRLVRHGIVVVIVATVVITLGYVEDTAAAVASKLERFQANSRSQYGPSLAQFLNKNGILGRKYADNINLISSWQKLFDDGILRSKQMYLTSDVDEDARFNKLNITEEVTSISDEELTKRKNDFLQKLREVNRPKIEKLTRNQSHSELWFAERRIRLTASEFGFICKRKNSTSCKYRVHKMLYNQSNNSLAEALVHGKDMEPFAIDYFQNRTKLTVKACGLIIDPEYPFLAASPDGLVGEESTLEIKSPFLARNTSSILEAITNKMLNYLTVKDGQITLKRDHLYYYQIMGQLRISGRQMCYFIIYTKKWVHIERIFYDSSFWRNKMIEPLQKFYMDCLLPEIIDPHFLKRKLISDIREPAHIKLAQQEEVDKIIETQRKAYKSTFTL